MCIGQINRDKITCSRHISIKVNHTEYNTTERKIPRRMFGSVYKIKIKRYERR